VRAVPDGTTTISYHPTEETIALSNIQKVELVTPVPAPKKAWRSLIKLLFGLALRVLFVFWFVSSWFPELGLTYWGLVLPVYIAMWIFRPPSARQISEKYLQRDYWRNPLTDAVEEHLTELFQPLPKPSKK
jgi:hypothetical protein